MSTKLEKNGSQSKMKEFFQMIHDHLKYGDLSENSDITADGPDYLFEFFDELEEEAPITNDLLQTGDIIDDLDGWRFWIEGHGYRSVEYNKALKKDFEEALASYQKETNTDWKPW